MKKLQNLSRGRQVLAIIVGLCLVLLSLLIAIRLAYRGRILPGITANGVYVSGLTKAEALRELNTQTAKYSVAPIDSLSLQGNLVRLVWVSTLLPQSPWKMPNSQPKTAKYLCKMVVEAKELILHFYQVPSVIILAKCKTNFLLCQYLQLSQHSVLRL